MWGAERAPADWRSAAALRALLLAGPQQDRRGRLPRKRVGEWWLSDRKCRWAQSDNFGGGVRHRLNGSSYSTKDRSCISRNSAALTSHSSASPKRLSQARRSTIQVARRRQRSAVASSFVIVGWKGG